MYDVIIVGGGIMGCSCAFHLKKTEKKQKVVVIERDPTYTHASTTLSLSNVRIQFSLPENIKISQYTMEILERFADEMEVNGEKPEINFKPEGNLFVFDEDKRARAEESMRVQQKMDCQVAWWSPEKIKNKFPWYRAEGFAGGTFGPNDGHIDAHSFLMAYRKKARSLGAEFVTDEVVEVLTEKGSVRGVQLGSGKKLYAEWVINCAGAWAAEVARTAGVHLPVDPVKRQVFVLNTAVKPDKPLPLTSLPSGLYLRTETGGHILLGKSMPDDPVGFDFNVDSNRFTDILWEELVRFVPAFDRLKVVRSWAGLYAVNTFDGNVLLGEWPEITGFFLANGFSGHGLQQAPAVGRYISELVMGKNPVLDLSVFHPQRILDNKPLSEDHLV